MPSRSQKRAREELLGFFTDICAGDTQSLDRLQNPSLPNEASPLEILLREGFTSSDFVDGYTENKEDLLRILERIGLAGGIVSLLSRKLKTFGQEKVNPKGGSDNLESEDVESGGNLAETEPNSEQTSSLPLTVSAEPEGRYILDSRPNTMSFDDLRTACINLSNEIHRRKMNASLPANKQVQPSGANAPMKSVFSGIKTNRLSWRMSKIVTEIRKRKRDDQRELNQKRGKAGKKFKGKKKSQEGTEKEEEDEKNGRECLSENNLDLETPDG